ncbi:MAG: phage tail sheath subtilisin-like domain-containing protein [Thermoanaerobaculia bacterium]|nr:phage tail sheath subtilisin-like domain-containing protein [Thermoanaerobaculia bacterium]
MPEYLAPGVFVEEVSFRSKSIEGVPTSTTGFAGLAPYGPVCWPGGPKSCEPRLVTSFVEFERIYGGLGTIAVNGTERIGYLAHAARAFFDNGGKRLYISRVFVPLPGDDWGGAQRAIVVGDSVATWKARWPGSAGNVRVLTEVVRSKNIAVTNGASIDVPRAKAGMVVEVFPAGTATLPVENQPLVPANLRVVRVTPAGVKEYVDQAGAVVPLVPGDIVQLVELRVTVQSASRSDQFGELAASPLQKRYIGRILQKDDPEDEDAPLWLDFNPASITTIAEDFRPAALMRALQADGVQSLAGGHDGAKAGPDDLKGEEADLNDPTKKATGLEALGEVEDIAIVALPDGGTLGDTDLSAGAAERLISHATRLKYRIAIVDAPEGSSMNEIRDFRGRFDSTYAALYHPWIEIYDPTERPAQGAPPRRLLLPPSGFVAGIYARNDITRGVHKAPANEVVRGLTRFEANINTPRQEVLNPEGINALRFFEGRGHRVWGARTMSSDPEWKYVNVRRLFLYLERSIDKGTQWAVFEPNNRMLWDNVRRTIEDFLLTLWRDGALLGDKPEQAFFVRCDRTTMTQNDLDNGRLICLIGIAPVKPAEFVIFRIGQWTADAPQA